MIFSIISMILGGSKGGFEVFEQARPTRSREGTSPLPTAEAETRAASDLSVHALTTGFESSADKPTYRVPSRAFVKLQCVGVAYPTGYVSVRAWQQPTEVP